MLALETLPLVSVPMLAEKRELTEIMVLKVGIETNYTPVQLSPGVGVPATAYAPVSVEP